MGFFSFKDHWYLAGGYLATLILLSYLFRDLLLGLLALPVGFITVLLTLVAKKKYREKMRQTRQAREELGLSEDGRLV